MATARPVSQHLGQAGRDHAHEAAGVFEALGLRGVALLVAATRGSRRPER